MFDIAIESFKWYSGSGLMMTLFLIAVCYLWITEENKNKKSILVYGSICILVLFFCPVFSYLTTKYIGNEIYYRVLWLLPIGVTIAYAMVRVLRKLSGIKKWIGLMGMLLLIIFSGKYTYSNGHFSKAVNMYHVPDYVIEVCDYIIVPGREVVAAFPAEFLQYVRQYTGMVHMPYGRELFMENEVYVEYNPLYNLLEAERIDAVKLSDEARVQKCHYIIVSTQENMDGSLESNNWECLDTIDGYNVYVDNTNNPRN